MKILFVLENLKEVCGANVSIAINLAKGLKRKGHKISVLTYGGITREVNPLYRDAFDECISYQDDEISFIDVFNKLNKFDKLFQILFEKKKTLFWDTYFDEYSNVSERLSKKIENEVGKQKYDIVLGVSIPYYIAYAVATCHVDSLKCVLQLDPYSFNSNLNTWSRNKRISIEKKTISQLDILWAGEYFFYEIMRITSEDERKNTILQEIELPGIVPDMQNDEKKVSKNHAIHFFFVGRFYSKIRNPSYLLELFSLLPNSYYLHIVGGGCEKELNKYKSVLGDRLIIHGWVPKEKINTILNDADFLINVNNTITNQLSSKIFEYIGTGKPIVNMCKIENCKSRKYTSKYKYAIDVFEYDDVQKSVENVKKFVKSSMNKRVSKMEIKNAFFQNTDEYLCSIIERDLLGAIKRN